MNPIDLDILLVLLEGDAHAYGIVAALERRRPDARLYPASLYRRLSDLVDAGLLEERPVPEEADPRRRRYYGVTPAGRRAATEEARRLQAVLDGARRLGLLASS